MKLGERVFSFETGTTNLHISTRFAVWGDNVLNFGFKHRMKLDCNYLVSGDIPPSNGLIPL
jgi:hypothetical protein